MMAHFETKIHEKTLENNKFGLIVVFTPSSLQLCSALLVHHEDVVFYYIFSNTTSNTNQLTIPYSMEHQHLLSSLYLPPLGPTGQRRRV